MEGEKMRRKYLVTSTLLVLAFLLAACGGQLTPPSNVAEAVNTAAGPVNTAVASTAVQTAAAMDLNGLVAALQAAGVTVESAGTVEQPFFSVPGQTLKVNGQEVQAYVYDTPQAMETDAAQVSADGSTIGTNMPSWTSDPHFYKAGPLLVLYLGQDQKILDILSGVFGPQFAGR
jgi:hypothetical protein